MQQFKRSWDLGGLSDMPETSKQVIYVYSGIRESVSTKGKKLQQWFDVTDVHNDENFEVGTDYDVYRKRANYFKRLEKFALVGDVYEFTSTIKEDGKEYLGGGKRLGRWHNDDDIARWRAAELTTTAELEARKKSKSDDLMGKLEPFRVAYRSLGVLQQAQFIAKVVSYIVGRSTKK